MALRTKPQNHKSSDSSDILGAVSPANQYLVRLIEDKKELFFKKPTEDRMKMVFQVLEDILPELGIYTSVLKLIRDELYDGVYSSQLTVNSGSETGITDAATRAPYFSLLQCLQGKRNEEAEAVSIKLNDLRETLLQKEQEEIHLHHSVAELKENNRLLEDHRFSLNKTVHDKNEENKRLLHKYHNLKEEAAKQARSCEVNITDLKTKLQDAREQVATLSQYKKIYEELQEGFQYPMEMKRKSPLSTILTKTPENQKAARAASKAHLVSCIDATELLEHQVLRVQNSVFEDFDLYLESHKTWLASKMFQNNRTDPTYCDEELEMQTINKEFAEKQEMFQQSMAEIAIELALGNQHKESLQQQLNEQKTLNQERQDEEKSVKSAPHTTQAPMSKVTSGSSGLGRGANPSSLTEAESQEDETLHRAFLDAFPANEVVLNKYSAMLYISSNGGVTYEEVNEATVCLNCAEKTLLCPHKIGNNCVIALPRNCTHIKISRPKAHIITMEAKLPKAKLQAHVPNCDTGTVNLVESSSHSQIMEDSANAVSADQAGKSKNNTTQPLAAPGACKLQPPQAESIWQREGKIALGNNFASIWDNFRKCTQFKRVMPRIISLDVLTALFTEYYITESISNLALYDFLTAVEKYASLNRLIAVFGHILCGKLDAAVLRYIVLMAELVNCVSWKLAADFQMFGSVVYSLQEDEMETMMMGYLGFNERHISKTLVMEYILNLILTNSEPMFKKFEANLLQHSGTEPGYLTSAEFALAIEKIAPLCNTKVSQVLAEQSIANKQSASISLSNAAQITAYLILLQQIDQHQEQLQTKPERSLESTREVVPEDGHLITMSSLKLLANNIARMKKIKLAKVR
ncbi:uncharacterized protein LOC129704064 isoform X3 [Leucoraja erinacea]|uniref:uncharacterized protein LOC129704064 isoform X3 n=1 Tax=Leucoraja erinaceus TaxID=7782 RepID=UPI002453E662|nr:uncharacterized protein LOC129704064 isoform X3 [Leucoraja erinacea]